MSDLESRVMCVMYWNNMYRNALGMKYFAGHTGVKSADDHSSDLNEPDSENFFANFYFAKSMKCGTA